jgi:hypothetical protein
MKFLMKTVLTTTFLVAVLTIGIFGINNTYAQGNITGMMENDKRMSINATLASIPMNATLAFAQEGFQTEDLVNETIDLGNNTGTMGMDSDNKTKLNGTIDVHSTIHEAFKSKTTTDIIGAIQAAQSNLGANSYVKEAELTTIHGYLVYKIMAVDETMKIYNIIVDPGNGQVLMKKEVGWYDTMNEKMEYDDEKYGKHGGSGHEGYDDKNNMMKDKKY